jgi:hypothetical protein
MEYKQESLSSVTFRFLERRSDRNSSSCGTSDHQSLDCEHHVVEYDFEQREVVAEGFAVGTVPLGCWVVLAEFEHLDQLVELLCKVLGRVAILEEELRQFDFFRGEDLSLEATDENHEEDALEDEAVVAVLERCVIGRFLDQLFERIGLKAQLWLQQLIQQRLSEGLLLLGLDWKCLRLVAEAFQDREERLPLVGTADARELEVREEVPGHLQAVRGLLCRRLRQLGLGSRERYRWFSTLFRRAGGHERVCGLEADGWLGVCRQEEGGHDYFVCGIGRHIHCVGQIVGLTLVWNGSF